MEMKIKWERNSRALSLVSQGKIKNEDILPRSTTDDFPADAATVRIQKVKEKNPHVVVHIRGKSKGKQNVWNGNVYESANTCRVTVSSHWGADTMCSNGDLDEDLNWLDVISETHHYNKVEVGTVIPHPGGWGG